MKVEISNALDLLYPMDNVQERQKKFVKSRRRKMLLIGGVLCVLGMAVYVTGYLKEKDIPQGVVVRGERGKTVEFSVTDGNRQADITYDIGQRKRSREEIEEELQKVIAALPQRILNRNSSLCEVTGDLNLPTTVAESFVEMLWYSSNPGLVTTEGKVNNKELTAPERVGLKVTAAFEDYAQNADFEVLVLPYSFSEKEAFERDVIALLTQADERAAGQESFVLPQSIGDEKLAWTEKKQNYMGILAVAGILVMILGFMREEAALKERLAKREEEILADYPDFLSKFLLLLGSGMNVRAIWERIGADYNRRRQKGKTQYVYEEVLRMLASMEVGMPEVRAYEQFGRRLGQLNYLRFSGILVQNLKKGNSGIAARLQEESAAAFSERKAIAKRKGEQAGTKLLLPMGGMLVLVFAMILIPAFSTF